MPDEKRKTVHNHDAADDEQPADNPQPDTPAAPPAGEGGGQEGDQGQGGPGSSNEGGGSVNEPK